MNAYLADASATEVAAQRLAIALPDAFGGFKILLRGELGAGKSSFARSLLHALGHQGPVPSPTYALIEPYHLERGDVFHIDLYRVADEDELYFLGVDELDTGLQLIEWPERAPALQKSADLEIALLYEGDGRRMTVTALSARADHVVAQLSGEPNT